MTGCYTCHLDGGIDCDWPCAWRLKTYSISPPAQPDDSLKHELEVLRHRVGVLEGMKLVQKPPVIQEPTPPGPAKPNDLTHMLGLG